MSRLLALEWDEFEARVVVADRRGRRIIVQDVFPVDLRPEGDESRGPSQIGAKIAAALRRRGSGRSPTLVAVSRTQVELHELHLPAAPADELPQLVRLQAERDFPLLTDDWPLDFLSLPTARDDAADVLAAALPPDVLRQTVATCAAAGLKPVRFALRPCGTASRFRRQLGTTKVCVLIDLLATTADLTVVSQGYVVLTRTIRLPDPGEDSAARGQHLGHEIRRTIAAAQNRLAGTRIEAAYLFGDEVRASNLGQTLARQLDLPVEILNPFDGLTLSSAGAKPEHPGRFVPLLGMLLDEAHNERPEIAFVKPRPTPKRRLPARLALAATACLLLLVAAVFQVRAKISRLDAQTHIAAERLQRLDDLLQRMAETSAQVAHIDRWLASDIVWLDQFERLAQEFPAAEEAVLTELQVTTNEQGGRVTLKGQATDHQAIDHFEQRLRDQRYRVEPKRSNQDEKGTRYKWSFESSFDVRGGSDQQRQEPL